MSVSSSSSPVPTSSYSRDPAALAGTVGVIRKEPWQMTRAEVMVELQAYKPKTAADVIEDPAFFARRSALWKQLDRLTVTYRP